MRLCYLYVHSLYASGSWALLGPMECSEAIRRAKYYRENGNATKIKFVR